MKRIFDKPVFFPLFLLFICILVYGAYIPSMGFYWDDLPYIWFKVEKGIRGITDAIAHNRPMLSFFFVVPMALLGEKPLTWQFFGIFTRWLFTLSMFGFLQSLWPERRKDNQNIAMLLAVFPGFTQQWISVVYSHWFLVLSVYFLSLSIFTKNIKSTHPRPIRIILSLLLASISMFSMEYVFGLEFLRFYIIINTEKERSSREEVLPLIKKTISRSLPFIGIMLAFSVYRAYLAPTVLYSVRSLETFIVSPFSALWDLLSTLCRNIYTNLAPVWGSIFSPFLAQKTTINQWGSFFPIVLSCAFTSVIFIYKQNHVKSQSINQYHNNGLWIKEAIPFLFVILFFTGIPFWAANLKISNHFPNDRFFIPFMLGSTLFIYMLLEFLKEKVWLWSIIFCLVFTLSATYQIFLANSYALEWRQFTNFAEQLTWRVPSIEENTLFVTEDMPFTHYTDNSLTAMTNWLYANTSDSYQMPYMLNYTDIRLGTSLPALEKGIDIHQKYRLYSFDGSTDQMLIFFQKPGGCLHIADPFLDPLNPNLSKEMRSAAALSDLSRILPHKNQNKVFFVYKNHADSWCYYFQQASLASQFQDWDAVVQAAELAFRINDRASDPSEYFPFIFGYAHTHQWAKAIQLTKSIHSISHQYQPMICEAWHIINEDTPEDPYKMNSLAIMEDLFSCGI